MDVPITMEQMVAEARNWPSEKVEELVDRLSEKLHGSDSTNEEVWKQQLRRRLAKIESGAVKPVDGGEVSARIGRIFGR